VPASDRNATVYKIFEHATRDKFYPEKIAKEVGWSKGRVHYWIGKLEKMDILRRVPGVRPYEYEEGPKAALANAILASNPDLAHLIGCDGGGVLFDPLSYSRTHTPNRFHVELVKRGDTHHFWGKYDSKRVWMELFPVRPYNETNTTSYYKTTLPGRGGQVSAELIITPRTESLFLWSYPVWQCKSDIENTDNPFIRTIEEALAPLTKFAGWEFGDITWNPEIHYAIDIRGMECAIPLNYHSKDGHIWTDRSEGYLELETDDKETAIEWLTRNQSPG
jgi:hypothetical protein